MGQNSSRASKPNKKKQRERCKEISHRQQYIEQGIRDEAKKKKKKTEKTQPNEKRCEKQD
jgi:hypothetical protein